MRVCVQGLWHLGSVTAGCLASLGHDVTGFDFDNQTIANLQKGTLPVSEPGLKALIEDGVTKGNLRFTENVRDAVSDAQVLWVTYDTPVDDDDQANVSFVLQEIRKTLPLLEDNTIILVSSQLPVGSIRELEEIALKECPDKELRFCCSPENLRLGKALDVFLHPDRVIMGIRHEEARDILCELFEGITKNIVWMSVESAEMTKHAINAFLGMSVTFINEIAAICENVGADAREVEMGLKTEKRIGSDAYLSPGGAFSGGTLARDLKFLQKVGSEKNLVNPLIKAVVQSNDEHKKWVQRRVRSVIGDLKGKRVAVWGLTYKSGTNTLRRSLSVETCNWLRQEGAHIIVHDPSACTMPDHWVSQVERVQTPLEALQGVSALIIGTQWPEYQELSLRDIKNTINGHLAVFDSNRFLDSLDQCSAISYFSVGVGDE